MLYKFGSISCKTVCDTGQTTIDDTSQCGAGTTPYSSDESFYR